jgi:hypothetical protein
MEDHDVFVSLELMSCTAVRTRGVAGRVMCRVWQNAQRA